MRQMGARVNRIKKENIIGVLLAILCLLLTIGLIFITARKITAYKARVSEYQKELAVHDDITEAKASSGLSKKGNSYLIQNGGDLLLAANLINNGKNIEEGMAAAEASFRLTKDIDITGSEWNLIGSGGYSFQGSFDGDGHKVVGTFRRYLQEGQEKGYLFGSVSKKAKIENLKVENLFIQEPKLLQAVLAAGFETDLSSRSRRLVITLTNQEQCDELAELLESEYRAGLLELIMQTTELDTSRLALLLAEPGNQVKLTATCAIRPGRRSFQSIPNCMKGFMGQLTEEESLEPLELGQYDYLFRVRKELVDNLTCYIYEYTDGAYDQRIPVRATSAFILAQGGWEEDGEIRQTFVVPDMEDTGNAEIRIIKTDINFDTQSDLLFNLGSIYGEGRERRVCKGFLWNGEKNEFVYFPSMPRQYYTIDYEKRRVIDYELLGQGEELFSIYEIEKEELVKTGEVNVLKAGVDKYRIRYYRDGELVGEREAGAEFMLP